MSGRLASDPDLRELPGGTQTRVFAQRAHASDTTLSMSAAIGFSEHVWG